MAVLHQAVLTPNDLVRDHCAIRQAVVFRVKQLGHSQANQSADARRPLGKGTLASQIIAQAECPDHKSRNAQNDDNWFQGAHGGVG